MQPSRDTLKIMRVFALIRYLVQKPAKSVKLLAKYLKTTERTIYRDLKLLEELNYPIEKDFEDQYYIADSFGVDIKNTFSPQEALVIQDVTIAAAQGHPLKDNILKKLYFHSDLRPLADSLLKGHIVKNIEKISEAIGRKKQLLLKNYHSVKSKKVSEQNRGAAPPLPKTTNILSAFDPQEAIIKTFKTERIDQVEILEADRTYQEAPVPPDLFGMVGEAFEVHLALSDRSYRILIEEYLLAKIYTYEEKGKFFCKLQVQDLRGIGRFVLGLVGKVQVLAPNSFKEYLVTRTREAKF
ncbi:MAG: WYL domain-containing protein [Saprospiraceae bacterium]|nr:WYL domain-containing protein [Saprospiraceae bacterium]